MSVLMLTRTDFTIQSFVRHILASFDSMQGSNYVLVLVHSSKTITLAAGFESGAVAAANVEVLFVI